LTDLILYYLSYTQRACLNLRLCLDAFVKCPVSIDPIFDAWFEWARTELQCLRYRLACNVPGLNEVTIFWGYATVSILARE